MKEEKLKVLSLFSGIGAFEKALTNLNIDYELVGFSEIDKWAIKSYCAIHNVSEDLNLGDISKIKDEGMPSADLVTYGFPCQDISVAGLQKGIKEGTRSGLLYEAERIIEHVKPKYAIAENVKNLVGKKHKNDFDELLKRLDEYGYNNYWRILNASEHGIPQARERVFIVSIRKDIDQGIFEFEKPQELKLRFIDLLDKEVEEKYYIDNDKVDELLKVLKAKDLLDGEDINLGGQAIRLGGLYDTEKSKRQAGAVWEKKGIAPTITTCEGGHREPIVVIREATKKGYDIAEVGDSINISFPKSKTRRGRVGKEVAQTLDTSCEQAILTEDYRLRKITPLECWRLMGFTDEDYWKTRRALEKEFYNENDRSNSQMYKQAGNSICVNVLEAIFKELFKEKINE